MFAGNFANAPHVPRARAFVDSRDMTRNPVEVFERYRADLGETFTFHFGGAKRSVVSTNPAFIEHVLRLNQDNFRKSDIQVERMSEFQGVGLVNIHGDQWRRQRRLLARGFQPSRLKELLAMELDVLRDWMVSFEQDVQTGPIEVHQQMVRLTLCLMGRSLFGHNMSHDELEQIADTISTIQKFIVRQIVHPYMIPWYRISGQSEMYQQLRHEANEIVLRHIHDRRDEGMGETDLLRMLLETPYPDTGKPMAEQQAMIESLQLLVAGNETSSNALTWVLYLLGRHPNYIQQIRNEIERVIGDDPVSFDNLHQLELTLQVVHEALRLYPPFWMIDRIALQDDEIAGVKVPAGTMVIPYIYGTHRNPAIWPDADTFDPGRFSPEQRKTRHRFSYIPFGGGPRVCIGNNMAIMQVLLLIVSLVRKYDFSLAKDVAVGIRPMMLLRPDGPVLMSFEAL